MSTISKINLAGVNFDVSDKEARQGLLDLAASIGSGQSLVILPSSPVDKEAEYEGKYGIYVADTLYQSGKPLFNKGHVYYSDGTSWTDVTVANEKIIYAPGSLSGSLPIEDGEYSVAFDPNSYSQLVPSDIATEVNYDDMDEDAILELGIPRGYAVITVIPKTINSVKALLRLEVVVIYAPAGTRETKRYSRLGYIDNSDAIVWIDEPSTPSVTVDTTLDSTSGNPIANSAVTTALNEKTTLAEVHGNLQSWLSVTDKSDFLRGVSNYSHRNDGTKIEHYGKFGAAITSDNGETIPANSLFRFTSITTDSPMNYPFVGTLLNSSYEPIGTLVIRADSTADGNGQLLYYPSESPSSVTVDDALSTASTNPVQNAVVTEAINAKQPLLTAGDGIAIENNTISASPRGYELLTPDNGDYSSGILQCEDQYGDPGSATGTVSDWTSVKGVIFTVADDNQYYKSPVGVIGETQWKLSVTNNTSTTPNSDARTVTNRRKTFTIMKDPSNDVLYGTICVGPYGDREVSRRFTFRFNADGSYEITTPYSPKEDSDSDSDENWSIMNIYSIYLMR